MSTYAAHTGNIPTSAANLSAGLATATVVAGVSAGPFMGAVPTPAPGGAPARGATYSYFPDTATNGAGALAGAFVFCGSGDGAFANSSGVAACP